MKKVKITVLKTTLDEQLAREYGAEGLTACPLSLIHISEPTRPY